MSRLGPIHWKVLERFVLHLGCRYLRTEGDHLFYGRHDLRRPVVFPRWHQVPVFIIKNNIKTLGISRERYLEIIHNL